MFGIIISVIVLLTMGYLILKNYKPQVVLAAAGIFLMICGVWLGYGVLVADDKSSGYLLVDIYNEILRMLSNRAMDWGYQSWQWVVMPAIWIEWEPAERWLAC